MIPCSIKKLATLPANTTTDMYHTDLEVEHRAATADALQVSSMLAKPWSCSIETGLTLQLVATSGNI